jgi:hypothetical protein
MNPYESSKIRELTNVPLSESYWQGIWTYAMVILGLTVLVGLVLLPLVAWIASSIWG